MRNVNLSLIYFHLIQFYGVNKFEVFSALNEFRSPTETMIEFYLDKNIQVNLRRLNRLLEKEIKQAKKFFAVQEDSKLIICIQYNTLQSGLMDYDFEYSAN